MVRFRRGGGGGGEDSLTITMFVQEEKIFAGKVLKVHVCTMEGAEWLEEVTEDTSIEKLKEKCLKHVGSVRERNGPQTHHR